MEDRRRGSVVQDFLCVQVAKPVGDITHAVSVCLLSRIVEVISKLCVFGNEKGLK